MFPENIKLKNCKVQIINLITVLNSQANSTSEIHYITHSIFNPNTDM